MHWDFGAHQFDDERGVVRTRLAERVSETVLEPKASALLKYFCHHAQQDVSRDELIASVWHGQIVSDNAINRVIVQLRKALKDDTTPRQFIKTIPKVGYRLITRPIPQAQEPRASSDEERGHTRRWLLTGALVIAALMAWYKFSQRDADATVFSIQPLSREAGWQFDADLSPDLQQLIFSVTEGRRNTLFLQDVETGELQQVSPNGGRAHSGRWSHDGNHFVYIYHTDDRCEFHKVTVGADGQVQQSEALHTCRLNSNTDFALSLDDEILYFVERESPFSPYEAYALDMQERQRWKLAQPLASSYGNHYLDVHPKTGKVLLLSEPRPGKSAVYEIDVPGNGYRKLHDFDYDLYTAVWGHEADTVVHPAEHPSYQLLRTDLTSGQSSVIVSDSRRISTPRRINNGRDYLFASYLYNRDINLRGYTGPDFNSAVMDYLPELSHEGDRLAFVSKRAGFSQVLILEIASQRLRTLDISDQGLTYYNLAWAPDDEKLAANTSKGIVIYDLDQDTHAILEVQQQTYAVDWSSPEHVSFSQFSNGQWQAYSQDTSSGEVTALDAEVAFALANTESSGFVTQDLLTFRTAAGDYLIGACGRYISRFQLHVKFDNHRIYCPNPENPDQLLVIEADQDAAVHSEGLGNAENLSVIDDQIATAFVSDASSDVMRAGLSDE